MNSFPASCLGVLQSLADHDPDVDAVYRLTRPPHFTFSRAPGAPALVVPPGRLAPYNAQATLHTHGALWALLLPSSVHGRVSDIWRGYIAQTLMWDLGLRLAFTPPSVVQERNPHNWLADMQAEAPLYEQAGALVETLGAWRCDGDEGGDHVGDLHAPKSLPTCLEQLWVEMYERGVPAQLL